MDRELERRVWQRVLGQETEREDLARLLQLSRQQIRELKAVDRELFRREQIVLGLLNGLHEISGSRPLSGERTHVSRGSRGDLGGRCLNRYREMLELCIRLERHPRYGSLFVDLTRYLRAGCARLEQRIERSRNRQ